VSQRNVSFAWLTSILLLSVSAGLSWHQIQLTPDAGGQSIEVTGFSAFPIISALILLQAAALLASFFAPAAVGRWSAGLMVPAMLAHAFLVGFGVQSSVQDSITGSISEITGVAGSASQMQFVASSNSTYLWIGYLLAIGLNIALLAAKAFLSLEPSKKTSNVEPSEEIEDLWESQK
jgi:fatty acid desaturase